MIYIYCYSNNIRTGFYIGQTIKTLKERYENDHYKTSIRFYNALKIYNIDNFDRWIIDIVDTQEEADQLEIFWIAEMRRIFGKENVYNIMDGGRGQIPLNSKKGVKLTEEHKIKISLSLKGKKKPPRSKEHAAKIGLANIGKKRHTIPHTEESKIKCGAKNKGKTWKLIDGKRVWLEIEK